MLASLLSLLPLFSLFSLPTHHCYQQFSPHLTITIASNLPSALTSSPIQPASTFSSTNRRPPASSHGPYRQVTPTIDLTTVLLCQNQSHLKVGYGLSGVVLYPASPPSPYPGHPPMWVTLTCNSLRFLRCRLAYLPPLSTAAASSSLFICFSTSPIFMEPHHKTSSSFTTFSQSSRSGGRGRGLDMRDISSKERHRGRGVAGKDKIDALGRLLTRILRHMASELNLNMRSDGFVKVEDLLKLNLKTFANFPLRLHRVDDVREAVRRDNKQRFSLMEENGELWIRANQGHTITTVETESLLKPILSADEVPVCVHGTYKRNLESILKQGLKRMNRLHVHFSCGLPTDGEVISGMRRDVNILIYLDVRKALEEGMKLYISDNKVILTEGFEGVVPVKYFQNIESWPDRNGISF